VLEPLEVEAGFEEESDAAALESELADFDSDGADVSEPLFSELELPDGFDA
jgi:hypothetical protein